MKNKFWWFPPIYFRGLNKNNNNNTKSNSILTKWLQKSFVHHIEERKSYGFGTT